MGGYQALTQEQVQETTAHELGHGVDFTYGQNNQSNNDTFVADAQNDLIQLDFSSVGTVGHRTLRAPCSTTNTAPFDGVVDLQTGKQFCNGAVLATTTYRTMTNSKILSVANPEIFPPVTPVTYDELYAQTFAYQLSVKLASIAPASSFQTPANGVFARTVPSQTYKYFACTQTWTANVLPANPQLTPPGYCTKATSWYTPYEPLS